MTRDEYNNSRVIPERKRATRNGKRSVDAFIKSIRDRTAIEHPEALEKYDTDLSVRLMVLYFYFTKYITSRWETGGMTVFAAASGENDIWYTDNLLDGSKETEIYREVFEDFFRERFFNKEESA